MKMNEILSGSIFFGMILSIFTYWVGYQVRKKWNFPIFNPLLISATAIIIFLIVCKIDYETYAFGARNFSNLVTPATVCLAIPLYKQIQVLKDHLGAILISIFCGCLAHAVTLVGIAWVFKLNSTLLLSELSKSVTTAIAMGVSEEIGGIPAITVVGVTVAGLLGAIVGPGLLKLFRIEEPIAQGLALGTASHAIGTSKAVDMGEMQGAMSSLAIVVTGIMTVIIVPIVASYL